MKDSDIKAVAEALIKNSIIHSAVDKIHYCSRCDRESANKTGIHHEADCPVGIAEKLLEEPSMNRNQELLDKLLTTLDLEFKDATEGMEDGWYVWRNSEVWELEFYLVVQILNAKLLYPKTYNGTDKNKQLYYLDKREPFGQLAGPILGK